VLHKVLVVIIQVLLLLLLAFYITVAIASSFILNLPESSLHRQTKTSLFYFSLNLEVLGANSRLLASFYSRFSWLFGKFSKGKFLLMQ